MLVSDLQLQHSWRYCLYVPSYSLNPPLPSSPLLFSIVARRIAVIDCVEAIVDFFFQRSHRSFVSVPAQPNANRHRFRHEHRGDRLQRRARVRGRSRFRVVQPNPTNQANRVPFVPVRRLCPWTWLFLRHSPYLTPAALFLVLGPAALPHADSISTGISGTFKGNAGTRRAVVAGRFLGSRHGRYDRAAERGWSGSR